ncbi:MAG: hypothetical protein ACK41F_05955 [Fimbriimonadaceae bacterium]
MREEVKTPLIVAVIAIVVAVVAYFGWKTLSTAGNLDQGQVRYTPGKPPWEEADPSKRGPGGAPTNVPVAGPPTVNNQGQ